MDLTREQQRILTKYRLFQTFFKVKNLHSVSYDLGRTGISYADGWLLIFQNSSKTTKFDHFESFLSYGGSSHQFRQELIDYFASLPAEKQDKLLETASDSTLCTCIKVLSPDLQEKYFERFIKCDLSQYHIDDLKPEVKSLHSEEILSGPRANVRVLKEMWSYLSPESKSRHFDIFLQAKQYEYSLSGVWVTLDEEGQRKHMPAIISLYSSYEYQFDPFVWFATKSEIQKQFVRDFMSAIKKREHDPAYMLGKLWENTKDEVQNSIGRYIVSNTDGDIRRALYAASNSKLQSQLLAESITKCIDEKYNFESQLAKDLADAKDKVFEMNFLYIFHHVKQNPEYLNCLLSVCPDKIKEQFSSTIGKHFSSNLEFFVKAGYFYQEMLINAVKYLDENSTRILLENFFVRSLTNEPKISNSFFSSLSESTVAEDFWKAIKPEQQRTFYTSFIEEDKHKEYLSFLYNSMHFENYEEAKQYLLKYVEKYHPEKQDLIIEKLDKIFAKNNTITSTINFEFISSDLMDSLTEEQILRITHYPKVQNELVKYKDNKDFINAFGSMLKTNENWTLAADYIFKNMESNQYSELLLDIHNNGISPEYYNNFCIALSKPNYFGINSKEDIEQYFDPNGKRIKFLISIMNGNPMDLPDSLKDLSKEDLKKFAVSEYLFGMDLNVLNLYATRFNGVDSLTVEGGDYIKELVSKVSALNTASPNELNEIIKSIVSGKLLPTEFSKDIHLDSKAVNLFAKAFDLGVYKPIDSDQIESHKYLDKNIGVYRVQGDFKMLARVEGAYSFMPDVPNYKDFYDNPDITAHGNCESVIGQDQIGLARNKKGNIVVGYAAIPQNSMLFSAPYDLCSSNISLAPLHDFDTRLVKLEFYGLQEMIDNTRHTHNETVMERLIVDEHGNVQKLQPSYLIWVEDRKTDKFPPEFGEPPVDNETALANYNAKVRLWEQTQKAAYDLGIPIIIINRELCAEKEMEKLEALQKILKGESELPEGKSMADIAKEAITKFENNAVGLEFAESDVQSKYFTHQQRKQLMSDILGVLDKMPEVAYEERLNYLNQLTEIVEQEHSKRGSSIPDAREFYSITAKSLADELVKYEEYIGKESPVDLSISEETKSIFETDIRAIATTHYYDDNKSHSIEHIEKVMLFSAILAKNENLDEKDTKTLLAAAAFHDSFRAGNDGNGEHAIGSAQKAKEFFESNPNNSYGIKPEDVPLIQVAIAYHEHNEQIKGKVDRAYLSMLCEEYGYTGDFEKAVQISSVLKDADALDRERFGTKGRLDPEYLRTDSAKSRKMILFAQKVNGVYAKEMLERNYETDEPVSVFTAVKALRSKRVENSQKEDSIVESTLSVDEMLGLFEETEKEYTKGPSDTDKKKGLIKVFGEVEVTGDELSKAKGMLGIDDKTPDKEQTK